MEIPLSETKQERRIRIQRQRAKKKNKNFWERKKTVRGNKNRLKKAKLVECDEISQKQAWHELRAENVQCRLKHMDRKIRGYYRFGGADSSAELDELNEIIMLENQLSEQLMQADVDHVEISQFIMMGAEIIDLTDHDECELTGCMSEYDDLERHERQLDLELDRLSA